MTRARIVFPRLALVVPAALAIGCADFGVVAQANRENLDGLEAMEMSLRLDASARAELARNGATWSANERQEFLAAKTKARIDALAAQLASTADLQDQAIAEDVAARRQGRREGKDESELRANAASIDARYRAEADRRRAEATLTAGGLQRVVDALAALRANGADIQEYLELPWWRRLYTDVKGMDREQLDAIGNDLDAIRTRLRAGGTN